MMSSGNASCVHALNGCLTHNEEQNPDTIQANLKDGCHTVIQVLCAHQDRCHTQNEAGGEKTTPAPSLPSPSPLHIFNAIPVSTLTSPVPLTDQSL
eukprot:34764-Pelagomonas_calceolata.AAC.5